MSSNDFRGRRPPQSSSPGDDPLVTRLLRDLYAAPSDAAYWAGLEGRIMARVAAGGGVGAGAAPAPEWWQVIGEWIAPGLAAAGIAALLAGATLLSERSGQRQIAYRSVLEASAARPTPPAIDDRDGALSYFLSPR